MGEVLSVDIHSDIERAWPLVDKQNEGKIPRNLLQSLVEIILAGAKVHITKDQALSYCSPYLTGNFITKDQVFSFLAEQKSLQITNFATEALKKQVEWYFSDENLSHDKFFHELISSDEHGYVKIEVILKCQRVKNLKATKENILEAILTSTQVETNQAKDSIRRKNNSPPPVLKTKKGKKAQPPEQASIILSVTISEESKVN